MPPFHMQRNDHAFLSFAIQRKSGLNWRDPSLFLTRFQVERKEGRGETSDPEAPKERKKGVSLRIRTHGNSVITHSSKTFRDGHERPIE